MIKLLFKEKIELDQITRLKFSPAKCLKLALLSLIMFCSFQSEGQNTLDKQALDQLIESMVDSLETYYVDLEIGKKIGQLLLEKNKRGAYDGISNPKELAKSITKDLRSINGDLHLSLNYQPPQDPSPKQANTKRIDKSGKWSNYGFKELKILEDNIAYLKIKHFSNWDHFEPAKQVITDAMAFLKNSDGLIIDVRNNPGGFEYIVAYLISYFFDGKAIHLSDYYYRYQDSRYGIYTLENIPGRKLPDIPIYVLVNKHTASAAESLAYMLKHLKRATIIGETTAGAGNGAMYHSLNNNFRISIASETTINAITKTSFEQVGVIPNIKKKSEEAFEEAYALAKKSAPQYRAICADKDKALLVSLNENLKNFTIVGSDSLLLNNLSNCQKAGLLDERKINSMGYDYLYEKQQTRLAEAIFKANKILFPNSANVYDSYAESLYLNNNLKEARRNYQMAVDVARRNRNTDLQLFIESLEKIDKELLNKK